MVSDPTDAPQTHSATTRPNSCDPSSVKCTPSWVKSRAFLRAQQRQRDRQSARLDPLPRRGPPHCRLLHRLPSGRSPYSDGANFRPLGVVVAQTTAPSNSRCSLCSSWRTLCSYSAKGTSDAAPKALFKSCNPQLTWTRVRLARENPLVQMRENIATIAAIFFGYPNLSSARQLA